MDEAHAIAVGVTPISEPGNGATTVTRPINTYPIANHRLAEPGMRAARTLRIKTSATRRAPSAASGSAARDKDAGAPPVLVGGDRRREAEQVDADHHRPDEPEDHADASEH